MRKLNIPRLRTIAPLRAIGVLVSVIILAAALSANVVRATKPTANELGIGVEILPTQSDNPAQLGANSELWFAIEPGQSAQRQFRIIGTSDIAQSIAFELWQVTVVDGEPTIDRTTRSPSEEWVTFDPPTITLEPRARQTVTMTYTIPANTEPAVFESYLRILVSARDAPVDENPGAGVQAVIQGALAFRKSVWLGIGDAANLATDFEIRGVAGWLTDKNEKAVRVLITNTGGTPIRPSGSIQLADPQFASNTFGPFAFQTNAISPGDSAYGDAIVDPAINDGRWSIFVQATQGSIRKTAKFDQDIKFDRSLDEFGSLTKWTIRLGVGLLGLGLVCAGYVLIRGKRTKSPPPDDPPPGEPSPPASGPSPAPVQLGTSTPFVDEPPEQQEVVPVLEVVPKAEQELQVSPPIPAPAGRIIVSVAGAVRNPGFFEVEEDTRVGEVIELAGGPWTMADTAEINLARRVVDGEQIFVPRRVLDRRETTPDPSTSALDLNLANSKQLSALPGIGPDLASAIVAYRRQIGRFTSVEQLLEVKGMGPRKLAGIASRIRV